MEAFIFLHGEIEKHLDVGVNYTLNSIRHNQRGVKSHTKASSSVQPFNAPFPRREPRRVENKNKNRTPGREKRKRRNEVKRARWSWQGAASGPADRLTHTRTHTQQTALIAAVSEDLRAGQRWLLPHKESLGDAPLPTKWRIYQ